MENRSLWVDYSKAIGLLLVVYGHVAHGVKKAGYEMNASLYELMDSVIYSFHMPLFFFLSGLHFFSSKQKMGANKMMVSKVDTIIYPFIVWTLLQGALEAQLSGLPLSISTATEVASLLIVPKAHFWFLYALFCIFLVATLLYRACSKNIALMMLPISVGMYLQQSLAVSFLPLSYVFESFIFFSAGVYFNEIKKVFEKDSLRWCLSFFVLFVAGQYYFHEILNKNYLDKGLVLMVLALISIMFVVTLSMQLGKKTNAFLYTLGSLSMYVYLMHVIAYSAVRIILHKGFGVDSAVAHLTIGTAAGLLFPLLFVKLLGRGWLSVLFYPPKLLSVRGLYSKQLYS